MRAESTVKSFCPDHAIAKMVERNISPRDLADALAQPDQTYLQGARCVYQYLDFSVIVETNTNDVLTALFRGCRSPFPTHGGSTLSLLEDDRSSRGPSLP
ncbi:hypothetical protein GCM10027404_30570 [Arthrobacter tumbae]